MALFDRLCSLQFSICPPLLILFYLVPFLSYLMLNNIMTVKFGLEITQGHLNWYHSKAWLQFFIRLLQYLWPYLVSYAR